LNSKAELMKINDTNLFRNTTAEAVNLKGTERSVYKALCLNIG